MEKNVVMELVEVILSKEPQDKSTKIQGKTMAEKLNNLVEAIRIIDNQQQKQTK